MAQRIVGLLIVAAVLGLGACTTTRTVWVKPGASAEDFARDSHECERDARASAGERGPGLAGGGGLAAAIESGGYQSGCLRRRGWAPGAAAAEPAPNVAPTAPGPPAAGR